MIEQRKGWNCESDCPQYQRTRGIIKTAIWSIGVMLSILIWGIGLQTKLLGDSINQIVASVSSLATSVEQLRKEYHRREVASSITDTKLEGRINALERNAHSKF